MTKTIEEQCESLQIRNLRFPLRYLCTNKEYCDYKTTVNSEPICVKYMDIWVKIEKEKR